MVGVKHRLPLVAFANANIVVAPANVELREVLRAFETMDEVVDEGEGVAVLSLIRSSLIHGHIHHIPTLL